MMQIDGQKIVRLRALTAEELLRFGWFRAGLAIELENGVILYPAQDGEGNESGALMARLNSDVYSISAPEE